MSNSYCVKCKRSTGTSGAHLVTSANGRRMMKGQCVSCGTNKSQFVSASGSPKKLGFSELDSSNLTAGVLPKRRAKKGKKSGAGVWDVFKMIF